MEKRRIYWYIHNSFHSYLLSETTKKRLGGATIVVVVTLLLPVLTLSGCPVCVALLLLVPACCSCWSLPFAHLLSLTLVSHFCKLMLALWLHAPTPQYCCHPCNFWPPVCITLTSITCPCPLCLLPLSFAGCHSCVRSFALVPITYSPSCGLHLCFLASHLCLYQMQN